MKFYNTLSREKEIFKPIKENEVTIYTCGPTVYDRVHIGNLRTFLFEDVLKRYLKYKGYKVTQVMNLTDDDDKTIRNSQKNSMTLTDYTRKYENLFFADIERLGFDKAEYYPRATDHINEMLAMIKILKAKGYTYEQEGSTYFSISKFKVYGKLSKIDLNSVKNGVRYDSDEYEKDDVRDFVLWKRKKGEEPAWESEFGEGRPGWHIECSAMANKYLGKTIDIHCGAVDLIFPHHENEIAQSEATNEQKFVNYWLHAAFVNLKKTKISKSLGNLITLEELVNKGFNEKAIRFYLISNHYRSALNFDEEDLKGSVAGLNKINDLILKLSEIDTDGENFNVENLLVQAEKEFSENMDDDLNISGALGALFTLIKNLNILLDEKSLYIKDREKIISYLKKFDTVLNVCTFKQEDLSEEVEAAIQERLEARKNKNFKLSDEIRDRLLKKGVVLEDTSSGTRWKKI